MQDLAAGDLNGAVLVIDDGRQGLEHDRVVERVRTALAENGIKVIVVTGDELSSRGLLRRLTQENTPKVEDLMQRLQFVGRFRDDIVIRAPDLALLQPVAEHEPPRDNRPSWMSPYGPPQRRRHR
jgi:hypothetical protein